MLPLGNWNKEIKKLYYGKLNVYFMWSFVLEIYASCLTAWQPQGENRDSLLIPKFSNSAFHFKD